MTAAASQWAALRPDEDRARLGARVRDAYERFVDGGDADAGVRTVVVDSWERSRRSGVDPAGAGGASGMGPAELRDHREAHPMAAVLPVVRKLLVEDAAESRLLAAISDEHGRLLWVEGDHRMRDAAADMHFVEGADWSEDRVGTNAPGTALVVDHGVQIFGSEHYSAAVQQFSCAAAPVHDPVTGHVLGTIDITGGPRVAAPEVLTLVRATVAAAEAELRLYRLAEPAAPVVPGPLLQVLGAGRPRLRHFRSAAQSAPVERTLSPRHAEILLLLTEFPEGLGAEQLALLLDDRFLDAVTVRAEMSRLRRVIGADLIGSRPYRLLRAIGSDVEQVRSLLRRGDTNGALRLYRGPLLPDSVAPGVTEIRDDLSAAIRAGVRRSADPRLLRAWVQGVEGRDDVQAWRAYRAALPAGSAEAAQVGARLEVLDRRFGVDATSLQPSDL